MRLLYHYIARGLKKKKSRLILDGIKGGVAVSLAQNRSLPRDYIYSFLTTSRPVEKWLQRAEENIKFMASKKVQIETSMIIGGYGSGKTHIKDYLTRNKIDNISFIEIDFESLTEDNQTKQTVANDIFSLILLNSKTHLDMLYDKLIEFAGKDNDRSPGELDEAIRELLRQHSLDNQFIRAFCTYGGLGKDHGDFRSLEDVLSQLGRRLFLPLIKMYKKYLNIQGLCIIFDEFEHLQFMKEDKKVLFVASIRHFHDTLAEAFHDSETPSCKMIILCTLSFWNEIIADARSQALETRVALFEIPPLVEDEIMAMAEKLYALYKTSGLLKSEVIFDSTKLQNYLVEKAGLENPLTPRFVIEQLVMLIEYPEDYIRYLYQS